MSDAYPGPPPPVPPVPAPPVPPASGARVPPASGAPVPPASGLPAQRPPMPAMQAGDWAAPYATPTRPGLPPATAQRASSPAIGIVALVLAIIAFVVPASIAAGTMARIGAAAAPAFWYSPTMWDWGYLTPVKGEVLTTEIAFWAGTVLGAVAIVLGVTAIARRRGRGFGIAAIVIGVVAFFVFMVVAWVAFIAGTAL